MIHYFFLNILGFYVISKIKFHYLQQVLFKKIICINQLLIYEVIRVFELTK